MVPPLGIEPSSSVLQTGAMTTSAKAAKRKPLRRSMTSEVKAFVFGVSYRYRSGTTSFTD